MIRPNARPCGPQGVHAPARKRHHKRRRELPRRLLLLRVPHTSFLRVGPMLCIPGRTFAAVGAKGRVVIPRSPAKARCLRSEGGTTRNLLLAWECRNCRSLGRLGRPRDDNGSPSPRALLTK
jgi:hypothetical protein